MANRQQRGVYVGLAVMSALIVLVSSVVAVARLGSRHSDRHRQVAMVSPTTPSHQAAPAAPVTENAPSVSDVTSARVSSVVSVPRVRHQHPPGDDVSRGAATEAPVVVQRSPLPPAPTAVVPPAQASAAGTNRSPAEEPSPSATQPLVAASVSAGKGPSGGVVGFGVDHDPAVDVTVGTTPMVGHAPPSQGTEIALGGQLLHPPPTIPVLPAAITT